MGEALWHGKSASRPKIEPHPTLPASSGLWIPGPSFYDPSPPLFGPGPGRSLHLIGKPKSRGTSGLGRNNQSVPSKHCNQRRAPVTPMVPLRPVKNNSARSNVVVVLTESTLLSHRLDHLHTSQQPVEPPLQSLDAQSLRPPHRQPPAHSARSSHRPSSLPPSRPQAYRPARHTKPSLQNRRQYHSSRRQYRQQHHRPAKPGRRIASQQRAPKVPKERPQTARTPTFFGYTTVSSSPPSLTSSLERWLVCPTYLSHRRRAPSPADLAFLTVSVFLHPSLLAHLIAETWFLSTGAPLAALPWLNLSVPVMAFVAP